MSYIKRQLDNILEDMNRGMSNPEIADKYGEPMDQVAAARHIWRDMQKEKEEE